MILSEGVQQEKRFVLVHQDFVDALLRKYHCFIDHTRVFLFHLLRGESAYPCSPTVHSSHNFLITLNCQFISHLNRLENIRSRSVSRREEAETQNVLLLREHFWVRSNEAVRKENRLLHMAPVPGIGEYRFDRPGTARVLSRDFGSTGKRVMARHHHNNNNESKFRCRESRFTTTLSDTCGTSTISVSLPGKSALLIMKERGSVSSPQYPDKVYAKAEETVRPPAVSKKEKQTKRGIVQPVGPRPYDMRLTVLNLPGQRSKGAALSFERPTTLSGLFHPDRPTRVQSRLMALPTIQVLAKSMARNPFDHVRFSLPQDSDHDLNGVTGAMPTLAILHAGIAVQKAPVISLGAVTYGLPASARGKGQGDGTEIGSPPIGLQRPRQSNDLPRPEFSHADDPGRPGIRLLHQARTAVRQDVPNLTHPPREAARESTGDTRHVDRKTETIAVKTTLGPVVTQQRDVHQTDPIDVQQIANRVYGLLVDRITRERKMRGALRR